MNRDEVMRWVVGYDRAWRDGNLDAVAELFTEDARYRPSPYEQAEVGHAAIRAFWLDDEGQTFTVRAQPVAVEGLDAVVRLEVRYGPCTPGVPRPVGAAVRRGRTGRGLRGVGVLAGSAALGERRPDLTPPLRHERVLRQSRSCRAQRGMSG